MSALLRGKRTVPGVEGLEESTKATEAAKHDAHPPKEADPDDCAVEVAVPVPSEFEYHTDGVDEDE